MLAGLLSTTRTAQTQLAIDFESYSASYLDTYATRVVGWTFTVGVSPVKLTRLGFFDASKDGLVHSHDVGLYDKDTKALLASGNVASGTGAPLLSWFRMVDVADLILAAGKEYVVAASLPGSGDAWVWRPDNASGYNIVLNGFQLSASLISGYEGARYEDSTSVLEFPDQIDNGNRDEPATRRYFVGPNLEIAPVPEPSQSATALACAALVWGAVRRLRRDSPNDR